MNPGDRMERYQILDLIGRGAMGEVYRARDLQEGEVVALKIVYSGPDQEDRDVVLAERLGAELQKRVCSADPRVVKVRRYGEGSGNLFIDMEFIEGQDLSTILSRGPMDPRFAAYVARELCQMLENLRAFTTVIEDRNFTGVIHGDLKPRNIRLDARNSVRVLDFGIAKALSTTRKYTMNLFGSTAYCSPERLESQNMDSQSDLWSVGVLLYQMITARLPFDEPTKERLERRIRSRQAPDRMGGDCPEPLLRIVLQMLAGDPAQRYADAAAVNQDLQRFQNGVPVLAKIPEPRPAFDTETTVRTNGASQMPDTDRTVRTAPPRIPAGMAPAASLPARRRGVRSPRLMGCLAVFAVVALAGVGFLYTQWSYSNRASELQTGIQTEQIHDLNDAWNRYQELNGKTHLPLLLWGAKGALRKRLVADADEILTEYRNNDAPTVFQTQWTRARADLTRALELAPDDNAITGRLRVCEGHLDRIAAGSMRGVNRQRELNAAVSRFNEAAELLKHSPDPYLGLARVYVYDLNDVERAEDALNKAARHGHPQGKRETAQLADGYKRRADRFLRDSLSFARTPDRERDYLEKARQDYVHAQDLYRQAGLFGDAGRNEILAIQGEQKVQTILTSLQGSAQTQ